MNPKKILRQIAGWTLIVLGIISGAIPVIQGWILILLGLTLLAEDSAWAKKWLDKLKQKWDKKK